MNEILNALSETKKDYEKMLRKAQLKEHYKNDYMRGKASSEIAMLKMFIEDLSGIIILTHEMGVD